MEEVKSLFQSKTLLGLVTILITGFVRKHLDEEYRGPAINFALEFFQWVVGPGIVLLGRVFATKKLVVKPKNSGTIDDKFSFALLALLPSLFLVGCGPSAGYKDLVSVQYPIIADRMDRYDLEPSEDVAVSTLRSVAANPDKITFETAYPAWQSASPIYRERVAADPAINERRRAAWLKTADIIDIGQVKEQAYREAFNFFGTKSPEPESPVAPPRIETP
jgi:hypothetical protein